MGQSTQNEVEQYSSRGNKVTNVLSCPLAVKGSDRSRHILGRYDFFAFPIIIKDLSRISVTACFCHISPCLFAFHSSYYVARVRYIDFGVAGFLAPGNQCQNRNISASDCTAAATEIGLAC